MFDKIFESLFVKGVKKSNVTVLSKKREIKPETADMFFIKTDEYWDNRGKVFGALFSSLNGRVF